LKGAFGAKGVLGLSQRDGFAPAPGRSGGADTLERLYYTLNALRWQRDGSDPQGRTTSLARRLRFCAIAANAKDRHPHSRL
jgi:hypothetical protein